MDTPCDCESGVSDLEYPGVPRITLPGNNWSERAVPGARIVPFLEKRTFTFSTLNATSTLPVVLCPAFCVLDAYHVRINVRVHTLSMGSGQSLSLILYGTLPSEEDPSQDFNTDVFTSLSIDSSVTAPSLVTGSGTNPEAYLKIVLAAQQGSTTATMVATLSACLILRTGSR